MQAVVGSYGPEDAAVKGKKKNGLGSKEHQVFARYSKKLEDVNLKFRNGCQPGRNVEGTFPIFAQRSL